LDQYLLWFALPANSGIYYYPFYRKGIEVRCKDGKPSLLVKIKSGRGRKLLGHGDEHNSWPIIYLYPEASDNNYKHFPSTDGTQCSYRIVTSEEKSALILKTFKICLGDELMPKRNIAMDGIKPYL